MTEIVTIILTALITTLVTGSASMLGFWLLHAKNLTSREEVEKMIKELSPYVQDKPLIFNRLDNRDKVIDDMSKTIHEIFAVLQDLRIDLKEIQVVMKLKEEK